MRPHPVPAYGRAMTSTSPPAGEMLQDVRRYGLLLIVAGALGVVAGLFAVAYPDITLLALALVAGINLMVLGIAGLIDAFGGERDTTVRVLCAVLGLLGLIAGLVVIRRPGESLLAILLVLGIWLVVNGIVDFVRAFATIEDRALRLLSAIVDVVLGVLILALPELSLGTLAILVGISFIVRGGVAIARGIALRRHAPPVAADAPPPAVAA
jgi:uncharacterized membrane protein HdeD (DUF308 family)